MYLMYCVLVSQIKTNFDGKNDEFMEISHKVSFLLAMLVDMIWTFMSE